MKVLNEISDGGYEYGTLLDGNSEYVAYNEGKQVFFSEKSDL